MSVATQRSAAAERLVAPTVALGMVALQIAANATREALFLSSFPVTALPMLVALTAVVSFAAALAAGRVLAHAGPRRAVPALFVCSGALFAAEAILLQPFPAAVAIGLYLHVTVLGAIVISAFWSLLNERFDAHAAKPLFSRVAAAATLGSVLGGLGAERVAATSGSPWAVLVVLAAGTAACVPGVLAIGRECGDRNARESRQGQGDGESAPEVPYLHVLAAVTVLAAIAGTLSDYLLKADVVAHVAPGAPLIRFFGVFYSATGLAAFLVQALLARVSLQHLGIAGTLAAHPLALGLASLLALIVPAPWRGVLPRGADFTARHSFFRTAYELLFTPLPDATRRRAKTTIDVGWDCVGHGLGAALVFLLTRLLIAPNDLVAIVVAIVLVAAVEAAAAWQLRSGYVRQLEGSLRRRGGGLPRLTRYTFSRVTEFNGQGSEWTEDAAGGVSGAATLDPRAAALDDLLSGDVRRVHAGLRRAESEPLLVAAVVPLLAEGDFADEAARALRAHGPRVAGQLADFLADPRTPDVVRRRLPPLLRWCGSTSAFDALLGGLADRTFTVRQRCARALLEMSADHPAFIVSRELAVASAERELASGAGDALSLGHVFDLLALAYDREAMAIARRASASGDAPTLGTALAYLEATLPRPLFTTLEQRMTETRQPQAVGS